MDFFKENIKVLRKRKGETQAQTAFALNFTQSRWNNYETGKSVPSFYELLKIIKYFDVSASELLEVDLQNVNLISKPGFKKNQENVNPIVNPIVNLNTHKSPVLGEKPRLPLVVTMDISGRENVVLVPVKARAGYLTGYGDPEFIKSLPTYSFPALKTGTYRAFEVEGYSNSPTLSPKDLVICEYVDSARDLREGDLYVFVSKNDGIVVKRPFYNHLNPLEITLKGDNYADHPILVIALNNIIEVWRCVARLTKELRPISAIEVQLQALNSRVTRLENQAELKVK
ncbi:MAG: helix-turn-helix domain-containing protein [Chitinophagaceae bacterium]|nr:helix-turn-helix domain-containing protein [Chitinophagaceae bacterium]